MDWGFPSILVSTLQVNRLSSSTHLRPPDLHLPRRPPSSETRYMSAYENVVGGKLKLKGKRLDVKAGGVKKKKKHRHHYDHESQIEKHENPAGSLLMLKYWNIN
uniref:Uncharacterized protein LOC105051835 isoform X1 n=1 Tax=Elaeis guineensis var. tenera TaxID=51953 RepID=A0A8N4F7G4_ELAGV|nr:uncharacterized protein LOC105051835 isoform X1 [Elaeis guineensis]